MDPDDPRGVCIPCKNRRTESKCTRRMFPIKKPPQEPTRSASLEARNSGQDSSNKAMMSGFESFQAFDSEFMYEIRSCFPHG